MEAGHGGDFSSEGWIAVRSALDEKDRAFLWTYLLANLGIAKDPHGDRQVPGTPSAYADVAMETLLEKMQPLVEHVTGLSLYPTYSYVRLYKHGDVLVRHVDRPACEISVSVCLGYEPELPWPIWLEAKTGPLPVSLYPGDMLLYRGPEVPHWRESYAGVRLGQAFLHYVDQNGPYPHWKFDKRAGLRLPPNVAARKENSKQTVKA